MKDVITKAAGLIKSDTPVLDAELLLAYILGVTRNDLFIKRELIADEAKYFELVVRRAKGEPIAYITGQKEFWKDVFKVTQATLIPRPETELIIETALKYIPKANTLKILDLGTGTGCIALSMLREFAQANAVCVDVSIDALNVAQVNAKHLGLVQRCEFVKSDWFQNLEKNKFDLIVSNPPYISVGDELGMGVREYEPHTALFAEENGLAAYKILAENASKFLVNNGLIIIEIGKGQEDQVIKIFQNYELLSIESDLSGINRVLAFRWVE